MKRIVYILAAAALAASLSFGAANFTRGGPKSWDVRTIVHNQWEIRTSNYGQFVCPEGSSAGFWPAGSGHNYIYGAGIWIGANALGNLRVTQGYNPNNGYSEFTPSALNGDTTNDATAKIYLSSEPDWPFYGRISDFDTYARFDDWDPAYIFAGGAPLKAKVTQTTYAWRLGYVRDVVFVSYEVTNASGADMADVYLGACFDADIGNEGGSSANDRTAFDYQRNLAMQFQAAPEPGWDLTGVVGARFFESPSCNKPSVSVVDDQYPHTIYQGQQLGMTALKIPTLPTDPPTDADQYHLLQGYDWLTMVMDAYDQWGAQTPGDKRIVMATGPFDLPADSTVRMVVGIMAAADTAQLKAISDYAQLLYDNSFAFIPVSITNPLPCQVASGTVDISWSTPTPDCTTDVYYSNANDSTWILLASGQPGSGSLPWNTALCPDGVKYKIGIYIHNATGFGWMQSDSCFAVNNAGNAPPQIEALGFASQPLSGTAFCRFLNGDADNDYLSKSLFVQKLGWDTARWEQVSSSQGYSQFWSLDSLPWNTLDYPNYWYNLRISLFDGSLTTEDTLDYYHYPGYVSIQNAFPPTQPVSQTAGTAKFVTPTPYVIFPAQLTGHNYEYRFKQLGGYYSSYGYYVYLLAYDFWDADLNVCLLPDLVFGVRILVNTYLPGFYGPDPADGIVPEVHYVWDGTAGLHCDSVKVTAEAGAVSLDTLAVFPADTNMSQTPKWQFRGCRYEIRWHEQGAYPGDTLTAEVWDMDNNVLVPQDTTSFSDMAQSGWGFGNGSSIPGRSIITNGITSGARKYIYICGARYCFNRGSTGTLRNMTWSTHPSEGEVWTAYTHGVKPPRDGDVYRFQGAMGVAGRPGDLSPALMLEQNLPNPFTQITTIRYQLAKPGLVSLRVYNVAGQMVRTVVGSAMPAGRYSAAWDGRDEHGRRVSAGVYLYQLQAGDKALTRKMVLVR